MVGIRFNSWGVALLTLLLVETTKSQATCHGTADLTLGFTMDWEISGDETSVDILLTSSTHTDVWLGWAVSTSGMPDGRGFIMSNSALVEYDLLAYSMDVATAVQEDLTNSVITGGEITEDVQTVISFTRPINTADDLNIPLDGSTINVLVSYGSSQTIGYHAGKANTPVDFSNCNYAPSATNAPTATPTATPTPPMTPPPTNPPSAEPTASPTPSPQVVATPVVSPSPSNPPTSIPTAMPTPITTAFVPIATNAPTTIPTAVPTPNETPPPVQPTPDTTPLPTPDATNAPSSMPTAHPTPNQTPPPPPQLTNSPSATPTDGAQPTPSQSNPPTAIPTAIPTPSTTDDPSVQTNAPTTIPTAVPTTIPTAVPTTIPTAVPTPNETPPPAQPTPPPTPDATPSPTPDVTGIPSPDATALPTTQNTPIATLSPTNSPTLLPAPVVTSPPTTIPTHHPTPNQTNSPTNTPTSVPTPSPTPILEPTTPPTPDTTLTPTDTSTNPPTATPTATPTVNVPGHTPQPSNPPSAQPTAMPTPDTTNAPTTTPTTTTPSGECIFGDAISDTFLWHYACQDERKWPTYAEAESLCCACTECSGVTQERTGLYSIRRDQLRPSGFGETSWRKDFSDTSDCPYELSEPGFLRGYACDNQNHYLSLIEAQNECCGCSECSGVTCESAGTPCTIRAGGLKANDISGEISYQKQEPLACSFGSEQTDTFLLRYACSNQDRYSDLESAQKVCCDCQTCGGVTQDGITSKYTIREGPSKGSLNGESSWTIL